MPMPANLLAPVAIDDELLAALVPIGSLPSSLRTALASRAMIYELTAGGRFDGGDIEMASSLFLVRGNARLLAPDSPPVALCAGRDAARSALYGLAAQGAHVEADDDCRLLQVDSTLIASLLTCIAGCPDIADEPTLSRLLASEPFSRLPPAGLYRLGSQLQRVNLEAGDYVLRQNDPADYYYLLARGRCAVEWRAKPDDDAVVLATVEPGEGFGEEALLGDLPRATSVRTLSPCVLFRLTRASLEQLMQAPSISRSDRADAARRIAEGAFWMDVRLPEEHQQDAPTGSVNVPLGALEPAFEWLDKDAEWIVICDTGLRSEAAVAALAERGFNVRHLDGGIYGDERHGARELALGDLQRRRVHADAELESALHETALADAAVTTPTTQQPATAELKQAAEQAHRRLEEAIRTKLELDTRARHLEAEIRARRERALTVTARLKSETEQRLRAERDRLSREVADAASAMQALRAERKRAEASFAEEQRALSDRVQRARQELDAQARRIREEMQQVRLDTEEKLRRIRTEHGSAEREMLRAAEAKLRDERSRLQSEFADCMQAEAAARAELERIERTQKEAQLAAEQERSRLREKTKRKQAERAALQQAEHERLQAAAHAAERRVADAERLTVATQARREHLRSALEDTADGGIESTPAETPSAALDAELASCETHAEGVASELRDARAVYATVNQARMDAETRGAEEQAAEVELRVRLYEELEEALAAEHKQASTAPVARQDSPFTAPRTRLGTLDDPLPEGLLADLKLQLESEASGDALRSSYLAERTQLTREALADAAEQKRRARADLERARQHLQRLREAARKQSSEDD